MATDFEIQEKFQKILSYAQKAELVGEPKIRESELIWTEKILYGFWRPRAYGEIAINLQDCLDHSESINGEQKYWIRIHVSLVDATGTILRSFCLFSESFFGNDTQEKEIIAILREAKIKINRICTLKNLRLVKSQNRFIRKSLKKF